MLYNELEQLKNNHLTLELCQEMLLNPEITCHQSLLLIKYMTENLTHVVDPTQHLELLHWKLGVEAMERFPESLKDAYRHLASRPVLILEQLLMNMKVELAKVVIECFRTNIDGLAALEPLLVQFDDIVLGYAAKSLQVPLIEMKSVIEVNAKGMFLSVAYKNKGRLCNNSEIDSIISKRLYVENKVKLSQLTRTDFVTIAKLPH